MFPGFYSGQAAIEFGSGFVNGGAELGDMTGWTTTLGSHIADGPHGSVVEGTYNFYAEETASSKSYQRIDLLVIGFAAEVIDADRLSIVVDWIGGTFIQAAPPYDQPQLNIYFRNGALGLISTYNSGYKDPLTPHGTDWLVDAYEETTTVPALARYIDIEMEAKRLNGTSNDARFDDIRPVFTVLPP